MSAYPAYVMGSLCLVGGITGFVKTRSIPSIVAGVSVGLLYLWSADRVRKGTANGLEAALGASALLFLSSAPRVAKGPVPATLTATSALTLAYYGKTLYTPRTTPQQPRNLRYTGFKLHYNVSELPVQGP
ncbi:transmembrane proteins 14C-domain-containing protein [Phellopilus nigrolimitatus]|nr:transmembrane proteins 14C-domain-containing protein [Phellopilus nigrolimitatus]